MMQILLSPLVRLTNASEAKIEDIGPPAGLLNSLGSYITGTNLEEEDVVGLAYHHQARVPDCVHGYRQY